MELNTIEFTIKLTLSDLYQSHFGLCPTPLEASIIHWFSSISVCNWRTVWVTASCLCSTAFLFPHFEYLVFFTRLYGAQEHTAKQQQSLKFWERVGCSLDVSGAQGEGNLGLMRNTLFSVAQIILAATAERGGCHPRGDWRPEARHDWKTGALCPHSGFKSLSKGLSWVS